MPICDCTYISGTTAATPPTLPLRTPLPGEMEKIVQMATVIHEMTDLVAAATMAEEFRELYQYVILPDPNLADGCTATPEQIADAPNQTPVIVLDDKGELVCPVPVILFCDDCNKFFSADESWFGCTHFTRCQDCHTASKASE